MDYHRAPLIIVFVLLLFSLAPAQEEQRSTPGRWADQPHVIGQITAVKAGTFEIQTADNKTVTVKFTSDTRFRKDRAPAKADDFKVGDNVFAIGEQGKDGVFSARMIAAGMPGRGDQQGGPMAGMSREDLGKKFIMGEVKKIDETKLTILRPDSVEQVIEVDENTSFKNTKNESVTLADIKIGDHVGGRGELKDGVFVPQVLRIGMPPQRGQRKSPDSPPETPAPSEPK